jgi:hypothetical protein
VNDSSPSIKAKNEATKWKEKNEKENPGTPADILNLRAKEMRLKNAKS